MLNKLRPFLEPRLQRLLKPLSFLHPNVITLTGLIFVGLYLFAIYSNNYPIALLFLILSLLDSFDGVIARMTNKTSAFGGVLDSALDRIADGAYFCGFALAGFASWELVAINIIFSFNVSYLRARAVEASQGKISIKSGIIQRPERILVMIIAFFLAVFFPNLDVYRWTISECILMGLAIASVISTIQRYNEAYIKLKEY